MGLIDYLVNYCDEHYREHIQNSYPCEYCDQPHRCNENIRNAHIEQNPEGCFNCCRDIHFHTHRGRSDYNCDFLLDYYVCRYSYKYCSEVLYAYDLIDKNDYPEVSVLSLGCGPSPDLMAFENQYIPQKIKYIGIDRNDGWKRIHEQIYDYSKTVGISAEYHYQDVVELLCQSHPLPGFNVVIIEYLISHLINTNQFERLNEFFDGIVNNIVKFKKQDCPMLIIISDTDSRNTGRDEFWKLDQKIKEAGFNTNSMAKCFYSNLYLENSTQHYSYSNKFSIPENIKEAYDCAIECSSAQLIIEIR